MKIQYILIITLLFLLNACGGGENPDEAGDPGKIGETFPAVGNINPKLSGRVFVLSGAGTFGKILNLETGEYSDIPGMEEWDSNDAYTGIAFVSVHPNQDASITLETVQNCKPRSRTGLIKDDCVIVRNDKGGITNDLSILQDIENTAKISYSGEFIVLPYEKYSDYKNMSLRIYDLMGKLISVNNLEEQHPDSFDVPEFDWLPDGRLVYAMDQSIYITAPYDTNGAVLKTFTKVEGEPIQLMASPDGTKLAFAMRTKGSSLIRNVGTVWVMSIENPDELYELAIVPNDDTPSITDPVWSPDGRWIMVVEGRFNVITGPPYRHPGVDTTPILYAVPSDGVRVKLSETEETSAVTVLSNWNSVIFGGAGEINSHSQAQLVRWVP